MSDEQERTDAFVELCGGRTEADRLSWLYANSYPCSTHDIWKPKSKLQVFREKAEAEGFSTQQIEAFRQLQ